MPREVRCENVEAAARDADETDRSYSWAYTQMMRREDNLEDLYHDEGGEG